MTKASPSSPDIYNKAQTEILSRLRQDLTQSELSRLLGYKANQVHKWEAGRSDLSWRDFVRVCEVLKVQTSFALKRSLYHFTDTPADSASLVEHLTRGMNLVEMAKALRVSRSTISRWLDGQQVPTFKQVLRIIDLGPYALSTFLAAFLPADAPTLECLSEDQIARELNYEFPFAAALLRLFETKGYVQAEAANEDWIAQELGLNVDAVRMALRKLELLRVVEKRGGRYRTKEKRMRTMSNAGGVKRIITYWLERSLERIRGPGGSDERNLAGYLLFSATDRDIAEIRAAYLEFYQRVSDIIHKSKEPGPMDAVMLLGVQLFDVGQLPAEKNP